MMMASILRNYLRLKVMALVTRLLVSKKGTVSSKNVTNIIVGFLTEKLISLAFAKQVNAKHGKNSSSQTPKTRARR